MQIFLSQQCESLTGTLGRGYGYAVQRRKNGFYGKRNSKGHVPPDGHWRFILACAELAKNKLHIVDIIVSRNELEEALLNAGNFIAGRMVKKDYYHASDIINLKITFGL